MRLRNGEVLLAWPAAPHRITAGWLYSDGSAHHAIDLGVAQGTPVYAAEDGTVGWVQRWNGSKAGSQSYGNAVKIKHSTYNGKTLETLYGHLKSVAVKNGDAVREGQLLGYSGSTGNSTGPHLHFEVRLAGKRCNPLNWLDADFAAASGAVRLGSYKSVARPAAKLYKPEIAPVSAGDKAALAALLGRLQIPHRFEEVG